MVITYIYYVIESERILLVKKKKKNLFAEEYLICVDNSLISLTIINERLLICIINKNLHPDNNYTYKSKAALSNCDHLLTKDA